MIRSTSFVHLLDDAGPGAVEAIVAAVRGAAGELDALVVDAAPTAPVTVGGGQVMLLAAFRDGEAMEAARHHPYVVEVVRPVLERWAAHVESVRYTQGPVVVQDPGIGACLQRTLLLRVDPGADPARVRAFEHEIGDMGAYIDTIVNSSLSRVDEVRHPLGPTWTHVWEQEFASLEGLRGAYMQHPYHWALVDTWFDPQAPNHLVDTTLVHAACDVRQGILALA